MYEQVMELIRMHVKQLEGDGKLEQAFGCLRVLDSVSKLRSAQYSAGKAAIECIKQAQGQP